MNRPSDVKVTNFKYEQDLLEGNENFDQIKIITETDEPMKPEEEKIEKPIEKCTKENKDDLSISKVLLNLMSRESSKESLLFKNILSADVEKLQEMTKLKKKQIEKQYKYLG